MWAIGMFLIGKTLIPIYSAPMNLYINFTNQKEWRRYFIESKVQSFDLIYSYFFVTSNFCHSQSGSNLFFSYPYGIGHIFFCVSVCLFVCWFVITNEKIGNSFKESLLFWILVYLHSFFLPPLSFNPNFFYPHFFLPTFFFTPTFFLPLLLFYPHFFFFTVTFFLTPLNFYPHFFLPPLFFTRTFFKPNLPHVTFNWVP